METTPPFDIIDAHQHLGRSMFSHVNTETPELIAALDTHGIRAALVMPQPATEHPGPVHDAIAEAMTQYPGRIYGMCNLNPRLPAAGYRSEAKRCIEALGFKALKLHPLGHNVSIASTDARIVFETAASLSVPVLIHTGTGIPHALPSLALRPAREFPEVPIILCHAGWSVFSEEAIVAAEVCDNLYLEPSWCGPYQIAEMVRRLGPARVLFGSDHLDNIAPELAKFRSISLSGEALAACLGGTARDLFRLP